MPDREMIDVASAALANASHGGAELGAGPLVYFGRFAVRLSADVGAEAEAGGVRDLGVYEAAWPSVSGSHESARPFAPGGPAEALWTARVRELRADREKRPEGKPDVVILERQLAPNLRLMFRYDGRYNERLLAAEALLDAGDHGVWLTAPYQPGAEAKGLQIVQEVAASYHVYPPVGQRPEGVEPAFHLAHGAFELAPDSYENVILGIHAQAAGFESGFEIRTDTDRDPEWGPGIIAKFRGGIADPDGYAAQNIRAEMIRGGPRTVAGLPGEEVVVRLTSASGGKKEPGLLQFEWEYPGDPVTKRPRMSVTAASQRGSDERALAVWDATLRGIRAVPQGNTP